MDGPVTGGSFGMSGSDYHGDIHSRMPFTQEASPRPIGIAEMEHFRAARRQAEVSSQRADARHHPRRRLHHS